MRIYEYTYEHTLRSPPWIFDNPNWIPLLGARRFSTVLALHRPWLSCKIVFSLSSESYEFVPRSVGNAWRAKTRSCSRVCPFFRNFPLRYRPRIRENANPPLKISKLRTENKREMVSSVCFIVLLAITGGWSYLHRGRSNAGGVMFNDERGFYCWLEDTHSGSVIKNQNWNLCYNILFHVLVYFILHSCHLVTVDNIYRVRLRESGFYI